MHFKSKEIQLQYQGFENTKLLWFNTLNKLNQITDIQNDYTSLSQLKIDGNPRLGKLVEQFVFYQFSKDERIEIITENLQIQNDKITVGEIDCLLLENKQPVHLEIVYKFYLYDASVGSSEIDHWIGPNRNDSFRQKHDKLIQKQLPLLYHEKTVEAISKYNLDPRDIIQKVYFKAQLYPHLNDYKKEFPIINNECIEGFYIYRKELKEYANAKFYIPTKHNWLVKPHYDVGWLNYDTFEEKLDIFLQKKSSPLCWLKKANGELFKIFIVWW
ncbi:DUF1853 family protein [uncultured Tenacibaculum sp.]|uniref:DUF1853 family protein n=1 Tax=uncultured Tenacibaculum sp. TaxID=174713 RepID=UPI00261D35D5|nr:DUF1853 family protein [uncultured Tenacibaculum sp.]